MKLLVTGGAGFIGSALVRHVINNTEDNIINVDKLTYAANLESLDSVSNNRRYAFEHIDICDYIHLKDCFSKYQPDSIIHLAAESHVDRSISGPSDFIKTNIVGTYNLLEIAREYWHQLPDEKKECFRFHHVSTDEVYGDLGESNELFTENTRYKPSSPYSASKASSDHLVRSWHRTYNLPILVTNCSNNYGPYQFPEKLIPLMIFNALEGKTLPVYGKGEQVRDWLYVDDHVRAIFMVLKNGRIGETYNIGGLNEQKNIDVVYQICDILEGRVPGKPEGIKFYRDLIRFINDRPGHDQRYAIDASKITNELGWYPEESFKTGLLKTVDWYLNNMSWVNNIANGAYRHWIRRHYS